MKVAVTCRSDRLDAPMDPRFGRAAKFVIYDTETKETTVVDNEQNMQAMQGAGIQAAQNLVATGARVLITGNVGPKAFAVLSQAQVEILLGEFATAREALDAYGRGELKPVAQPNRSGHWM